MFATSCSILCRNHSAAPSPQYIEGALVWPSLHYDVPEAAQLLLCHQLGVALAWLIAAPCTEMFSASESAQMTYGTHICRWWFWSWRMFFPSSCISMHRSFWPIFPQYCLWSSVDVEAAVTAVTFRCSAGLIGEQQEINVVILLLCHDVEWVWGFVPPIHIHLDGGVLALRYVDI